jgi:serine/threonine-protein kinase
MNENAEDPQLLSIAESISDREPVDWNRLQSDVPPEQAAVLEELRTLEQVARLAEHAPASWGPYAIIEEIGHGVFGTVYRAHDPELRRDVAVKVVRPPHPGAAFDPDRALEEAQRLAKVNHPNVVRVFRADRIGDEVGISMELIAGDTLNALVKQRGPFSAGEAALIGLDLCRALAAVHATHTLHGDIKAHNVMRSATGDIVLTDFGTSKDLSRDPRLPGTDFAGTPLYLAPEVFKGAARTPASDIYSLGVLLYYLVTGSYPVDGSTKTELAARHTEPGARRLLRDVRPDLPEPFIAAVERAMAEGPGDRYPSAGAFEAALRPVVSRPSPVPLLAQPKIVSLVIALLIVTAGVVVLRPWASREAPSPSPEAAVAAPPGTYRVDAAIYREENNGDVRLASGSRVSIGDKLSLQLETSVPAYVYVVNEDESGEAYLLFPLPGQPFDVPLAAGRHRLPGMRKDQRLSWRITSAGVREHFVIFVTPERSTTFEKLFAALPPPTVDAPESRRLPASAVDELRGIGGLTAETAPAGAPAIRDMPAFTTPLPAGAETASGLWVRQVAFENPGPRKR